MGQTVLPPRKSNRLFWAQESKVLRPLDPEIAGHAVFPSVRVHRFLEEQLRELNTGAAGEWGSGPGQAAGSLGAHQCRSMFRTVPGAPTSLLGDTHHESRFPWADCAVCEFVLLPQFSTCLSHGLLSCGPSAPLCGLAMRRSGEHVVR